MRVSQAIARWCEDVNTPFVAGIPGNGILEIIDDLAETDVPFILTRHEQGAAMMAYSYAFQTAQPAVVVGSKAPGATNLAIGVMGAFVESLPMVVITAQVSNRHEGYEAFEEIDLEDFFRPITKWSIQVNNPLRALEILNEAYRRTLTGRPGPVHVSIPYNFMHQETGVYVRPSLPLRAGVTDEQLRSVETLLSAARRPVIIAGGGVSPRDQNHLLALGRSLKAPIVASWLRKPIPDEDPNCIGMAGIGGSPAARQAIGNADVVLALGCRFSEQMTEHYKMAFPANSKLIHVDIDPAVIGRVYPAELGIEVDLREFLPDLCGRIDNDAVVDTTWLSSLQRLHRTYRDGLGSYERDTSTPQGRNVVDQLREVLDDRARIVLDSGNYLHWAEQYFPIREAGQFHYPTSGTMGFGIPGAIGAKIAFPDDFVCALVGDGGFAMTMGELETAVRIGTPILVIIINNGTLGHIRMRQESNFGGRVVGTNFTEQRFAHIARAFGIHGTQVDDPQDLRNALTEAVGVVRSGACALLDVHVSDELAAGPLELWWAPEVLSVANSDGESQ